VDHPQSVPASLAMESGDRASQSFRLVCLREGERIESPTSDARSKFPVLTSALCTVKGRKIKLSDEDIEKALLNWLSPQRDEFYVLSFWPLLLLLACVIFILLLVISSGRCFEHER